MSLLADADRYVRRSGLVAQSIEDARRLFDRWLRRMAAEGICPDTIPPPGARCLTPEQVAAQNFLDQCITQEAVKRNTGPARRWYAAKSHEIRDLTGIRGPRKP
jgi:hypothetical protein